MRTILVPVDGSDHSMKAIDLACDLARAHGGRVALMHVLLHDRAADELLRLPMAEAFAAEVRQGLDEIAARETPDLSPQAVMHNPGGVTVPVPDDLLEAVGKSVLAAAHERAGGHGVETELLTLEDGEPAGRILAAAGREDVDAVVMGSRGLSEIEAMTFGSVSHAVFEKAACTCISVK